MVVEEKTRELTIMDGAAKNSQMSENKPDDAVDDASRAQASIIPEKKTQQQRVDSTSSSSSGSSSEDDFFQLTATALSKPIAGEATDRNNAEPEKPHEAANSSSAEDKAGSQAIAAGSGARDRDSSGRLLGGNQAPMQGSAAIEGYDPNRIPASVFARPKPAPGEWSTASNESLFSIQMGNSSFSRDHVFLFGRSGDHGDFPYGSSPEVAPSATPSAIRPGEMSLARSGYSRRAGSAGQANAETMKDVLKSVAEEHAGAGDAAPDGARHSSGSSRRSDASSIQSFAFPILHGGIGSLKVVPEQTSPQRPEGETTEVAKPQSPAAPPKPPPHNRWLFCFSCSFCHAD